ncbi:YncE family protein [Pendulispora rubella]|uniref:YncE family protein n=1 Tax=Pendulispora rubella TaxID=2741070 RepID=A0ABZ2KRQ3_9BACT
MRVASVISLSWSPLALLAASLFCVNACGSSTPVQNGESRLPSTEPIDPIAYDALFVVNGGDNSISVIDTENLRVAGTIRIKEADHPHHVYLNRDGSKMLVAVPGTDLSTGHAGHGNGDTSTPGAVLLLDTSTGATLASRRLPVMNHNAIFSPNEAEIWTAQYDGFVLVLDPLSLATRSSVRVGNGPSEVTFSLDGRYGFVANTHSASVSIVDPETKQVAKTISVGDSPVGAWQGRNGMAYVDNETDGTLSVIDTLELKVVQVHRLGFTPGMVGLGPDNNVWVADTDHAKVAIRRADADEQLALAVAGQGAHGIAFNGDGKTAYVSNQAANTVTVIDVVSKAPIATIPVGSKPNGMAWRKKR